MFDRVNELSESLIGDSSGEIAIDEGALDGTLRDDEHPRYVLASDSIEHETEGRTATVEPDGNHAVYLIVTDERVLVVLGGQPDAVEIEFPFDSIRTSTVESRLMSQTLTVGNGEEVIRFSSSSDDLTDTQEYIQRLSEQYRQVQTALESAEETFETLESKIRNEGDGTRLWSRVQSSLSDARHHATHDSGRHPLRRTPDDDSVQSEKLLARTTDAEREFRRRYVDAWLERGENDVERAREALRDDEYDVFCEAYLTASRAVSELRESIEGAESDFDGVEERVESMADRVDDLGNSYVDAIGDAHERATNGDTETAAVQRFEVYRRVEAAQRAGWRRAAGVVPLDLPEPAETIATEAIDAIERRVSELERTGDDWQGEDDSRARDHYERAIERLRDARRIVESNESDAERDLEGRLSDLQEKIERTKWEWGKG